LVIGVVAAAVESEGFVCAAEVEPPLGDF